MSLQVSAVLFEHQETAVTAELLFLYPLKIVFRSPADFHSPQFWEGWKDISTLCFWKNLFVFVHLIFISCFFVQLLWKILSKSCRMRFRTNVEEMQNCTTDQRNLNCIRLSFSYQAAKVCCLLLLVTNLFGLVFFLLKGSQGNCKYITSVLAETTQLISWIILLVITLNLPQTRSEKLSWVIRTWLISSFLQSTTFTVIDIQSILQEKSFLRIEQYTDIISLFPCILLFVIALRGTTGISSDSGSLREPLLQMQTSKANNVESQRSSLYGSANLLQLMTFSWLNPLFATGRRKPLEQNEVPDIDKNSSAEFVSHSFDSCLTAVQGGAMVPIIVLAHSIFQILQVASNYWMAWASPSSATTESAVGLKFLFMVYVLLSVGCSLCSLIRATILIKVGLLTSQIFFQKMLHSVLRAPMSFFDSTPSTARELARLSEIQRSPILHHFAESFAGATTIRAFGQKDRFSNTNLDLIDNYSRPWFHDFSAVEWFSFRLDLLSNFVFAFSLILLVNLGELLGRLLHKDPSP